MENFGFHTVDLVSCPTCHHEFKEIFETHINLIVSPSHESVNQGFQKVFAQNVEVFPSNRVRCKCEKHLNDKINIHRQTYLV